MLFVDPPILLQRGKPNGKSFRMGADRRPTHPRVGVVPEPALVPKQTSVEGKVLETQKGSFVEPVQCSLAMKNQALLGFPEKERAPCLFKRYQMATCEKGSWCPFRYERRGVRVDVQTRPEGSPTTTPSKSSHTTRSLH